MSCCGAEMWMEVDCDCNLPDHLIVDIGNVADSMEDSKHICPVGRDLKPRVKRTHGYSKRIERARIDEEGATRLQNSALGNVRAIMDMEQRGYNNSAPSTPASGPNRQSSSMPSGTSSPRLTTRSRRPPPRIPPSYEDKDSIWEPRPPYRGFSVDANNEYAAPLPRDWDTQVRTRQIRAQNDSVEDSTCSDFHSADAGGRGRNLDDVLPADRTPAFAPLNRPPRHRPRISEVYDQDFLKEVRRDQEKQPRRSQGSGRAWDADGSARALQRLRDQQAEQGYPFRN